MIRDDPVAAARVLARDLRAELIVGGMATEAAVERLVALAGHGPRIDLDGLSSALARAELTRERTRRRAADRVVRTLNTDLAIHPATLRQASAALIAAAARVERAERRTQPSASGRLRTVTAVVVALAGGLIAALGAPTVGLVIAVAGIVLAVGNELGGRWNRRRHAPSLVAADADLATTRRRWEQLVGPDTDPGEVEAIVHRFDPQHELVAHLVDQHPAVRAADRVADTRRLAHEAGLRTAERDAAAVTDDGSVPTVVVASPYVGLTETRSRALHRRLLALPAGLRVVVVLAPGPSTADDRVVDLTEPDGSGPLLPVGRVTAPDRPDRRHR